MKSDLQPVKDHKKPQHTAHIAHIIDNVNQPRFEDAPSS